MNSKVMVTFVFLLFYGIFVTQQDITGAQIDNSAKEVMVQNINAVQKSWKASINFIQNISTEICRQMTAQQEVVSPQNKKFIGLDYSKIFNFALEFKLPTFKIGFDSKFAANFAKLIAAKANISAYLSTFPKVFQISQKWPHCGKMFQKIPGCAVTTCNTGWACALASAMSDRLCIASEGKTQIHVSAMDIMQCCKSCSTNTLDPCKGGDVLEAWKYIMKFGAVSGGFSTLNRFMGCKPFIPEAKLFTCSNVCVPAKQARRMMDLASRGFGDFMKNTMNKANQGMNKLEDAMNKIKKGISKAEEAKEKVKYMAEKLQFKVGSRAYILPKNEKLIQAEILLRGSVQAGIKVYEDFFTYGEGVYKHIKGKFIGYHSVKIIGWGVDNNVPYWCVVNVWGDKFGDKGTIKILRGENHCGIEENVVGGFNEKNFQQFMSARTDGNKTKPGAGGSGAKMNSSKLSILFIVFIIWSVLL